MREKRFRKVVPVLTGVLVFVSGYWLGANRKGKLARSPSPFADPRH